MKTFDKVLLFFLLIAVLAALVAVIVLETGLLPYNALSSLFVYPENPELVKPVVIGVSAIVLLIAIKIFCGAFISRNSDAESMNSVNKTQITSSELGTSYITVAALNTMAHKRCMAFRFVNDCTTSVTVVNNGIIVAVKIVPMPDVNLPDCTRELQAQLKSTLEEQAGINVVEIPVLILPQAQVKQRSNVF